MLVFRSRCKKVVFESISAGAGQSPVPQCTVQQLQVHTVKITGGEFKGGARVVCATQSPANE